MSVEIFPQDFIGRNVENRVASVEQGECLGRNGCLDYRCNECPALRVSLSRWGTEMRKIGWRMFIMDGNSGLNKELKIQRVPSLMAFFHKGDKRGQNQTVRSFIMRSKGYWNTVECNYEESVLRWPEVLRMRQLRVEMTRLLVATNGDPKKDLCFSKLGIKAGVDYGRFREVNSPVIV